MNNKKCSKCNKNIEHNRKNQRYCKDCHNKHARETRKKHSELSEIQRLKSNCRSYLHTYLKRGKISKHPCEICGSLEVEAHHKDYNKPLEVNWLCREHHLEIHNFKTN